MRRALITAAAAALASLALVGCSTDSTTPPTAPATPAPASTTAVQGPAVPITTPTAPERVDAARFSEIIAGPGVVLIDVRTPEEFAAGHIDGAVNYNVEGPDFAAQIAALDPSGTYAVYCHSGNRSRTAVAAMSQAGIPGVYELDGGITAWSAAGYPVTQ